MHNFAYDAMRTSAVLSLPEPTVTFPIPLIRPLQAFFLLKVYGYVQDEILLLVHATNSLLCSARRGCRYCSGIA